jgi:hypothetical protein
LHKSYGERFTEWKLDLYSINHLETDSKTIDIFQLEVDKVILSNRGQSCVGDAFKATDFYKSLKFVSLDKKVLDESVVWSEVILPKGSNDEYYKVIIFLGC